MKKLKTTLLAFLLLFSFAPTNAQQTWQWGNRVDTSTIDIAMDSHGNSYVLWTLKNTTTIEGDTLISNGSEDITLSSFTCDGTYRWSKVIGGSSSDKGISVGVDTFGGVYIAGSISSDGLQQTINVSDDTIITPTFRTMLLVKYNTEGNLQWIRMPESDTITGPIYSDQFNMDVNPDGNCYWFSILSPGSYANGNYLATYPYYNYSNKGSCLYALKYDRNGNSLGGLHFDFTYSVLSFQSSGTSLISRKIKRDPLTKNYYLAGLIQLPNVDTLIFGNTILPVNPGPGTGYVSSFDSTGNFRWIQSSNKGKHIVVPAIDQQGYVYITGGQSLADTFAGWPSNGGPYPFPFLIKLDPNDGHAIWGTNATTTGVVWAEAVNLTSNTVGLLGEY